MIIYWNSIMFYRSFYDLWESIELLQCFIKYIEVLWESIELLLCFIKVYEILSKFYENLSNYYYVLSKFMRFYLSFIKIHRNIIMFYQSLSKFYQSFIRIYQNDSKCHFRKVEHTDSDRAQFFIISVFVNNLLSPPPLLPWSCFNIYVYSFIWVSHQVYQ